MSSSQMTCNRRLWVVTAACFLVCFNVLAVSNPKEAWLKINGKVTTNFNRKACEGDLVEVVLSGEVTKDYSDFRAMPAFDTQTDTKKAKCPGSIQDNLAGSVTFTKDSPNIEQKKLLRGSACGEKGGSGSGKLCIYAEASGAGELVAESATFTYNTRVTQVDDNDIIDKIALNGVIEFTVSPQNPISINELRVCYGKESLGQMPATDCPKPWGEETFMSADVKLSGLENGSVYVIKTQIKDSKDNTSAWSKPFTLTPIFAFTPRDAYDGAGGNLQYSCQSAQGSWLMMGFLFLTFFLLRRRSAKASSSHVPMLVLAILMLNSPNEARANVGDISVGILGSLYRPDLDNEKNRSGQDIFPFYRCQFRKNPEAALGPITPLMGAEMDYTLFSNFGTLKAGVGLGYTFVRGKGLDKNADGAPDCNKQLEEAPVSLHMWQVRPQLTWLLDSFVDTVPLFPYFRSALITHGYSFRSGKSAAHEVDHDGIVLKPKGFRFGWQAAFGLMLRLDFLEPGSVRTARGAGFFDHVALKADLSYTKINSFGRPGFNFSPKDVMGSELPLMWTFALVFDLP